MSDLRTYTCALCEEDFEKTRSDEEALTEARFVWGREQIDEGETSVVCEQCFQHYLAWTGKQIGRA